MGKKAETIVIGGKVHILLPGRFPSSIDPKTVACVRGYHDETGYGVVVHTTEGFSFTVVPVDEEQTAVELHALVLKALQD
ncbi:MAG: hypothetical protein Q7T74_03020 [Candidatus Saccharibacteria bacterium]|nr:hypothetical protein [Candidatus Saccharibacteria bacterium]